MLISEFFLVVMEESSDKGNQLSEETIEVDSAEEESSQSYYQKSFSPRKGQIRSRVLEAMNLSKFLQALFRNQLPGKEKKVGRFALKKCE